MSAGAFSDAAVVKASESISCIFIECNWGKANRDLSDRYGIGGYPTVLFCDPDGKPLGELESHEPAAVAKQIQDVASKRGGRLEPPAAKAKEIMMLRLGDALKEGRQSRKPVLLYFYDSSPPSFSVQLALAEDLLKDVLSRFVLGAVEYRKGSEECTKYDVTRAPTLLVLDATLAKPEEKPLGTIAGSRSARELLRELEALAPAGRSEAPAASSGGTRPAPAPVETLSDDELERKFIQARVAAALELNKKGKKDKAIETLEDIVKSYPKHVETLVAKKLLEDLRK